MLDRCNATSGQCECKLGVMGVKCHECQNGYYGMNVNAEQLEDLAALRLAENDADWELVSEDNDQFEAVACDGKYTDILTYIAPFTKLPKCIYSFILSFIFNIS